LVGPEPAYLFGAEYAPRREYPSNEPGAHSYPYVNKMMGIAARMRKAL